MTATRFSAWRSSFGGDVGRGEAFVLRECGGTLVGRAVGQDAPTADLPPYQGLLSLGGLLLVLFAGLVWLFLAAVGKLTLVTGLILFLAPIGLIPEVLLRLVALFLLLLGVHL